MGGFLSNVLGTNNNYQANSGYDPSVQTQGVNDVNAAAQALVAQMNGAGPNPALAQLQQTTQQNGLQAAGLIASQRGLNPGLAAKMATDNMTAGNNQAAQSAAILKAQQMQGAAGQLGQLGLGQQGAFNQANMGSQAINANVASGNQQMAGALVGGVLQGGAAAAGAMAKGGMVRKPMAAGGTTGGPGFKDMGAVGSGVNPYAGLIAQYAGVSPAISGAGSPSGTGAQALSKGIAGAMPSMPSGDPSPTTIGAPGAADLAPMAMVAATGGKVPAKASMSTGDKLKAGGKVPGKAKVQGDSFSNDTVNARLSPGEIVIPRHVVQTGDPNKVRDFAAAVMARQNLVKGKAARAS